MQEPRLGSGPRGPAGLWGSLLGGGPSAPPPFPLQPAAPGCPLAPASAPGVINGPWELIPGQLGLPEPPRHLGRAALFHLVIYRDGPLPPCLRTLLRAAGEKPRPAKLPSTGAQQHGGAGHRAPISQGQKRPRHQLRVALTPKSSCEGPSLPLPAWQVRPRGIPWASRLGLLLHHQGSSQIAREIRSPRKQQPCPGRDQQRLHPPCRCLSASPWAAESQPPSCPCPMRCDPAGGGTGGPKQHRPCALLPGYCLAAASLCWDIGKAACCHLEAGNLLPGY